MGRIVAIASGDLLSTRPLNKYAVKLAKKQNPNVLFIGTASQDAQEYRDIFTKEYNKLGCEVKCLCLMSAPGEDTIDHLLQWADIIYVGGGDTVFMMQMWKKYAVDIVIPNLFQRKANGSIAGRMDWASFRWLFVLIITKKGGGRLMPCCSKNDIVGLAMENNTAFVESDGERYFIRSNKEAQAFLIQYQAEEMQKRSVEFKQI